MPVKMFPRVRTSSCSDRCDSTRSDGRSSEKLSGRAMLDLRGLSVLLPLLIGTMAISLSFSAVPNLLEQKACSPWIQPSINDFICNDTEIMAQVSKMATTRSTIKTACSALSSVALGYWRDVTGLNRPLLMIGAVAEMVSAAAYLLASADWGSSPWIAAVMEAVVSGLFGEGLIYLGANCLVIANSDPEERTMKIQTFISSSFVAVLVASSVSGYFLTTVGYVWLFATCIFLHFLTLLSTMYFVEEVPRSLVPTRKSAVLDQLKEVFSSRPNMAVIWLMLACKALVGCIFPAESNLSLYYYQQRFHFTFREGTLYGTYQLVVLITGSFVMAWLLTKTYKWSDYKFGIASSLLSVISAVCTALANTTTQLILSTPLSIMKLNLLSIPQSILSKCITNDELGVYLGISSIAGICLTFGMNYLYNYIFTLTSKTLPGAFYFGSAACYFIIMILFRVSSCLHSKPVRPDEGDTNNCENTSPDQTDKECLINGENC